MLGEILGSLNNWFVVDFEKKKWEIKDGTIDVSWLQDGQYFLIDGSIFNDGLYQYPAADLDNEVFYGVVFGLAIPKELIALAGEIEEWREKNPDSAYSSESFGGYSYSKGTGADGQPMKWQDVFARRLNKWRKLPLC